MARPLSSSARSKMIESAVCVLNERGADGFTIDEVARISGVAKSTIYRHFSCGDELLVSAAEAMVAQDPPPDTGSLRGDIDAGLAALLEKTNDPSLRRVFLSLLVRAIDRPQFGEMHRALVNQHSAPLRLAVQRGIARGEVDPSIDIEIAIRMIQGPFVMLRLVEGEQVTPAHAQQILDRVIASLAPIADDRSDQAP